MSTVWIFNSVSCLVEAVNKIVFDDRRNMPRWSTHIATEFYGVDKQFPFRWLINIKHFDSKTSDSTLGFSERYLYTVDSYFKF